MAGILINDFTITPDEITTGVNPVTVTYDCDIDAESQNPITVKLFVLSSLAVSFDVATWEDTLQPGNNVINTERNLLANSVLTGNKIIRIRIRLEDSDGSVDFRNTSITYLA